MRAEGGERAFVSMRSASFLDECHEWPGSFGDDLVVIQCLWPEPGEWICVLSDKVEVIMFWF